MKHLNFSVETELVERKNKLGITWLTIVRAGITIIELCGNLKEFERLVEKFKHARAK